MHLQTTNTHIHTRALIHTHTHSQNHAVLVSVFYAIVKICRGIINNNKQYVQIHLFQWILPDVSSLSFNDHSFLQLYATEGTSAWLNANDVPTTPVSWPTQDENSTALPSINR